MMDECAHKREQINKNIELQMNDLKEMNITYWPFVKKMSSVFNLTGDVTLATVAGLNSDLDCDRFLNRPIPEELTEEDIGNLKHLDSWYRQFTYVFDLAKALNRNRFKKILSVFDGRLKNKNQSLKWTFMSGHDNDMAPLYNDLN